jgi:hypothetical protein
MKLIRMFQVTSDGDSSVIFEITNGKLNFIECRSVFKRQTADVITLDV